MESNSPQDGKHLTPDKESSVPDGEQFDSTRKSNTLQTAKLLLFGICMGVVLSMLLYLAICLNLLSNAMLFLLVFSLILYVFTLVSFLIYRKTISKFKSKAMALKNLVSDLVDQSAAAVKKERGTETNQELERLADESKAAIEQGIYLIVSMTAFATTLGLMFAVLTLTIAFGSFVASYMQVDRLDQQNQKITEQLAAQQNADTISLLLSGKRDQFWVGVSKIKGAQNEELNAELVQSLLLTEGRVAGDLLESLYHVAPATKEKDKDGGDFEIRDLGRLLHEHKRGLTFEKGTYVNESGQYIVQLRDGLLAEIVQENGHSFKTRRNLVGLKIHGVYAGNPNFNGAELNSANFDHCYFPQAKFVNCKLRYARFCHASILGGDFSQSDLRGAAFAHCKLHEATFANATLHGQDYDCDFSDADLTSVNFSDDELHGLKFCRATLTDVKFCDATLTDANFRGAKLRSADFTNAKLPEASFFDGADLRSANFDGAEVPKFDGQNNQKWLIDISELDNPPQGFDANNWSIKSGVLKRN